MRIASLDTIEISDESRQLFVAKSSNNKYLDIAGTGSFVYYLLT